MTSQEIQQQTHGAPEPDCQACILSDLVTATFDTVTTSLESHVCKGQAQSWQYIAAHLQKGTQDISALVLGTDKMHHWGLTRCIIVMRSDVVRPCTELGTVKSLL